MSEDGITDEMVEAAAAAMPKPFGMRGPFPRDYDRDVARRALTAARKVDSLVGEVDLLRDAKRELREVVLDIARSGVENESRNYLTVQIDRDVWDAIQLEVTPKGASLSHKGEGTDQ